MGEEKGKQEVEGIVKEVKKELDKNINLSIDCVWKGVNPEPSASDIIGKRQEYISIFNTSVQKLESKLGLYIGVILLYIVVYGMKYINIGGSIGDVLGNMYKLFYSFDSSIVIVLEILVVILTVIGLIIRSKTMVRQKKVIKKLSKIHIP